MSTSRQEDAAAVQRRGEPDRVKAFTDGVFAIVITILVLEISVPPGLSDQSLIEALNDIWLELVAWIISFLLTGMFWMWHRDLFIQIRLVDRHTVWLNLLFLVPVGLIPFATSVLSEYPTEAISLQLYGAVLSLSVLMRWVLYAYVMRRPELLWEPRTRRQRQTGALLALAPIAVNIVAMIVAGVAPGVSLALFLASPLLYYLLITVLQARRSTRVEAEDYS